jgi:hypothetical protein
MGKVGDGCCCWDEGIGGHDQMAGVTGVAPLEFWAGGSSLLVLGSASYKAGVRNRGRCEIVHMASTFPEPWLLDTVQ